MAKNIEDAVNTRVGQLINEAEILGRTDQYGVAQGQEQVADCMGWLAGAEALIELVCPSPEHAYRGQTRRILNDSRMQGWHVPLQVRSIAAVLTRLSLDMHDGLLASVANRARAETFDNFLDHADAYLKDQRKNEAGVIGGVVFEDTIRRICRDRGINENNVKLEDLISALAKAEVLSGTRAKRARVAAGIRTSATHARWEEFELTDVRPAIELTRELIAQHLDK